jgi:hypothetical protein
MYDKIIRGLIQVSNFYEKADGIVMYVHCTMCVVLFARTIDYCTCGWRSRRTTGVFSRVGLSTGLSVCTDCTNWPLAYVATLLYCHVADFKAVCCFNWNRKTEEEHKRQHTELPSLDSRQQFRNMKPFKAWWLHYVASGWTLRTSTFCPHRAWLFLYTVFFA